MRFWKKHLSKNSNTDFLPKFATEINKAFDMDSLIEMSDKLGLEKNGNQNSKNGNENSQNSFEEKFTNIVPSAPPSCNKPNCLKQATNRCGRCQLIWYCSRECQGIDWKKHKKVCVSLKDQGRAK